MTIRRNHYLEQRGHTSLLNEEPIEKVLERMQTLNSDEITEIYSQALT